MLGIGDSGKSWKTSLFGVVNIIIGSVLIAIGIITKPTPVVSVALVGAGIQSINSGAALLFAKDKDVTGVPHAADPKDQATTPPTVDPKDKATTPPTE